VKRRLVLAAMVLVTAWSLWAFAQGGHEKHAAGAGGAVPALAGTTHPPPKGTGEAKDPPAAESEEPAPLNWTEFGKETPPYIAMVINFGILVAGYYLLGKRPIAAGLQARRDSIAKEIDEAAQMKREAEARAKTYQAKLEALETEARAAREGLVRAGEAERDRIVADAEAKAERMRKDTEFLVSQELKQIHENLLRETVEAAVLAAEGLLKKRVTQADQERLAEDYLADLEGKRPGRDSARAPRPQAGESS
jgi:F-type H+-transporting ATPase subunit b